MIRPLAFAIFLLAASVAMAQQIAKPVLSEKVVNTIIAVTTKFYWKDHPDLASADIDTRNPPIDRQEAFRIIDNAAPAGAADFCHIDWQPYHEGYMQLERQEHHWNDAQMLYVEEVFKTTKDVIVAGMRQNYRCTDDINEHAANKLTSAERYVEEELGHQKDMTENPR